ncbi:hypothetical protein DSO57_1008201 [Entomophthora muscae]|uniref:Uncharacterized protein n=1 Tax=Entomophthora muscae TaxID=34485 RepID=A0ACC2SVZ4_9FUNG|nr:hypothetical protein DSO57_1008201 [Entomophthora muscae]
MSEACNQAKFQVLEAAEKLRAKARAAPTVDKIPIVRSSYQSGLAVRDPVSGSRPVVFGDNLGRVSGIFLTTLWLRIIFCVQLIQFPLIGESAVGSQGQEKQIKNKVFNLDGFYTPSAGHTPDCQASAGRTPGLVARLPPAKWGNCQKGKPKKAISPNPNGGGTAAQIWNLPNWEGVDKQSSITNNASTAKAELKCITVPEDALIPCHANDNNSLLTKPLPSHSQKGIPDNTKCLGFPVQCFVLFMPH